MEVKGRVGLKYFRVSSAAAGAIWRVESWVAKARWEPEALKETAVIHPLHL